MCMHALRHLLHHPCQCGASPLTRPPGCAVQPVHSQLLASKSAFFSGMWADVRPGRPLAATPAGGGPPPGPTSVRTATTDVADDDGTGEAMDLAADGSPVREAGGSGGGGSGSGVPHSSSGDGGRMVIGAALEGRELHDVMLFLCAVYRNAGPRDLAGAAPPSAGSIRCCYEPHGSCEAASGSSGRCLRGCHAVPGSAGMQGGHGVSGSVVDARTMSLGIFMGCRSQPERLQVVGPAGVPIWSHLAGCLPPRQPPAAACQARLLRSGAA